MTDSNITTIKKSNLKNVMQLCNYAAPYGGNFVESLLSIPRNSSYKNVYVFPFSAQSAECREWIETLKRQKAPVYFIQGSLLKNWFYLRQICQQHKVTLIHAHFYGLKDFFLLKLFSSIYSIPLVIHLHNHLMKKGIRKLITHLGLHKGIIVACSGSVAKSLKEQFPCCHVYDVTNAINFKRLDFFKPTTRINEPAEVFKVCMFGHPFLRKGVDLALDAVKNIYQQRKKIKLYIIFSVEAEKNQQNILNYLQADTLPNWVELLPPINAIADYLCQMDCFISPSREEGFCYAIPEAAYCNCQVIASDEPGQRSHKGMPHLTFFEYANAKALQNALLSAMQNHLSKQAIKERKKFLLEHYDISAWGRKVSAVYDKYIRGI